jgi:hypothetical protein
MAPKKRKHVDIDIYIPPSASTNSQPPTREQYTHFEPGKRQSTQYYDVPSSPIDQAAALPSILDDTELLSAFISPAMDESMTDELEIPLNDEEVEQIESRGCAMEAMGLEAAATKKRR